MSNPYQPGPIAGGVERLVGALMGGDEAEGRARDAATMRALQAQGLHASVEKKVTDAKLAADKRMAQQAYEDNLRASGFDDTSARLVSGLMVGGNGAQIEQVQKYGLRNDARTALEADPNVSTANAILGALAGKPMESVNVEGGQIIRGMYGDAPAIAPTEAHSAQARASDARATASYASADAARARAERTRSSPPIGAGRGAGGGRGTERERLLAEAKAILDGLQGDPQYDIRGVTLEDVVRDLKKTGEYVPVPARPGTIKVITSRGNYSVPDGRGRAPAAADKPPVAGARKAPDGNWYVQKDGKYYRVEG